MNMSQLNVLITFTEPLLGSCNANPELHREHIASKAPDAKKAEEEVEAIDVDQAMERATMVFPKDDTGVFLWNYQAKGQLKAAIGIMIETGDEKRMTKWTYKRAVDSLLFVYPRRIYLKDEKGQIYKEATEHLTRPLRCETMQGDRVALATSQMLPAGTQIGFTVKWIETTNAKSKLCITEEIVRAALDYGQLSGHGQWRGASFGTFNWEEAK